MKKTEIKKIIREEILREYSSQFTSGGYITMNEEFRNLILNISYKLGASPTNPIIKFGENFTQEDFQNITKIISKYLINKIPELSGKVDFN